MARSLSVHLLPLQFFYYFLYYTEGLSTLCVLGMFYFHLAKRPRL